MKKTRKYSIFPLMKGIDKSSIPGSQDARSLTKSNNTYIRSKPSLKKRPGLRRIPHIGSNDGVQAATHFFATYGGAQYAEVIRARKGRLEALRDIGSDQRFVDLGVSFSPTDVVTFERYQNILIISFENSPPLYYSIGGTPTTLPILSSHTSSPPGFFRAHDFRLFYSGRPSSPHKVWASAINNPFDYTLNGGGFSMSVYDGDGDPVGITAISQPFRGDIYIYKWLSCYRIYRSAYGYGIDLVTNEVGAVAHHAVQATPNDVFSVGSDGIYSLVMTDKYGAAEMASITLPIHEYFQENVNWTSAKNMIMTYDKRSTNLLLSYITNNGSRNILGYNIFRKEFFEWEDCEYPALGKYFDMHRQVTFVHDEETGLSILDDKINTDNGNAIEMSAETGVIFPLQDPTRQVSFTKGWLVAKPTDKSVEIVISYLVDNEDDVDVTVDTIATGSGATIDDNSEDLIGESEIGKMFSDMVILPFEISSEGHSIKFNIKQTPPESDPDQPCEIYGLIFEFDYIEDSEKDTQI
jgi:hypothetical protein